MSRDLVLALRLNAGRAAADLRRFTNGATADVRRFTDSAGRGMGQMSRHARQLRQDFNGLSTATKLFGAAATALAAREVLGGMVELERAMLGVKSNLVGGAKSAEDLQAQLAAVRDTAREVSNLTVFDDASLVGMTNQLLKSGVQAEFVNGKDGAALGTAALAQLGGLTPEAAAVDVGKIGHAFSFNSKQQYMGIADHIVKADDASAMNSAGIMYNMQQTTATASMLKIDAKRVVSLIAYLDSLGNEAGTSINRMLENLEPGTRKKRKAMAKSGMDFWQENKDGSVVLKDLGTVTEIIRNKFAGMKNTPEKMHLAKTIFGEEGMRAVLLLTEKTQTFADFEQKVDGSTGAITKLKIQMEGLGAAVDRLKNTTFAKIDTEFAPERDGLTAGTNALTSTINNGGLPDLTKGVAAAGGLYLLNRFTKNRKDRQAKEAAGEAAALESAAAAAKPQNVFVTNWPASMMSPGEKVRSKNGKGSTAAPSATSGATSAGGLMAMGPGWVGLAGKAILAYEVVSGFAPLFQELMPALSKLLKESEADPLKQYIANKEKQKAEAGDAVNATPAPPAEPINIGGEIRIKIESPTPVAVTGMKTNDPRVNLNVDSGLTMPGAR